MSKGEKAFKIDHLFRQGRKNFFMWKDYWIVLCSHELGVAMSLYVRRDFMEQLSIIKHLRLFCIF